MSFFDWRPEELTTALPPLPWRTDELEPVVSRRTVEFHWDVLHRAYLSRVRELMHVGRAWRETWPLGFDTRLTAVVARAERDGNVDLWQQASQALNHAWLWKSLVPPQTGSTPPGMQVVGTKFAAQLHRQDTDPFELRDDFVKAATSTAAFGSAWTWVVADRVGEISVVVSKDAAGPPPGLAPLLVIDTWDHAWCFDRSSKKTYVNAAAHSLLNWKFAAQTYDRLVFRG